ncbi:PBSX family phage terminase large subunit [Lactobacillus sp. PV034]|uniref:PBSX family phage terminase large subunit n=1 Tax=Lactobacillus sp. PV034 TaxID=2594495 RepID=UPI0022400422|nr:PBSX family phage terminase large subunit [Lactobacillus sp. PV034]QNQ80794.1 PBSX family phage terminase large subunit [Lactobacillus sp. PV034]
MRMKKILTKKQEEVLYSYFNDDWKTMILAGAKRAGKTVSNNYIFFYEIKRVAKLAKERNDPHPQYILAGYSSNSIYSNVISSIATQFGIDIKIDRHGHYHLFGVDIVPAYTGSIRGLAAIRGMTSYGAYVNEASLAVYDVFQEIVSRCSEPDSRVICDTNPDIPTHWLKTRYIDNHDPAAKIKCFNFTIDDNTFLDPEYVKSFKAQTPKGMFYDRDILGLWVTGEGIVYQDFNKDTMLITESEIPDGLHYYAGVDWGFEHLNSIGLFGDDDKGNTYFIKEFTGKHKFINHWVEVAHQIQEQYGKDIVFYCDSARPDNISEFQANGINAINANKSVLPGIEFVAKLMKTGKFFVNEEGIEHFLDEVYQYIWNEKTGEPVKEHDDVMDMMRYAIYSKHYKGGYVPWT